MNEEETKSLERELYMKFYELAYETSRDASQPSRIRDVVSKAVIEGLSAGECRKIFGYDLNDKEKSCERCIEY